MASAPPSFIREAKEIRELLDPESFGKNVNAPDQLQKMLEKYQNQPELLDPHLEEIVSSLMKIVKANIMVSESKSKPVSDAVMHRAWRVVYTVCKVRGHKTVAGFFPHSVADLEPCLNTLLKQKLTDYATWQTRYGLLIWLSLIVLIPFDLTTVDSMSEEKSNCEGIILRLINTGKRYLGVSGPTRDAASYFLARLFSRKDLQNGQHLESFAKWSADALESQGSSVFLVTGVFQCLAAIFRKVPRSALASAAPHVIPKAVQNNKWLSNRSGLLRKLSMKLAQRLGLSLLPKKIATWRYRRGHRLLIDNLNKSNSEQPEQNVTTEVESTNDVANDVDDDVDVPEVLEDVIEVLLTGLRDKDTIVRWSAAKGIGRITMRLPIDFADDVVESVLELFSPQEPDSAWHGGCLAVAELARRGLMLPKRLPEVIPKTIKALTYDVRQGAHSVGSHVRDAACYVAWAFARAYSPSVMKPFVLMLAQGLLTVAVFDREINVRRAAAAAFQENVGRQGNFPHGIAITTKADYFTLGNRSRAYCVVAVFIARFMEYRFHLIEHLVAVKLKHWAKDIRTLAADSLRYITKFAPRHFAVEVLPSLVKRATSFDVSERHGVCLGIARVLDGLSACDCLHLVGREVKTGVLGLIPGFLESKMLLGRSGSWLREALMVLAESLSICGLVDAKSGYVAKYQRLIEDNLRHETDSVRDAGVSALRAFAANYYKKCPHFKVLVPRYIKQLQNATLPAYQRRGYILGLGVLPKAILCEDLFSVVQALSMATNPSGEIDPEGRRDAVLSLQRVSIASGAEIAEPISPMFRTKLLCHVVMNSLLFALSDYAIDRRGDVGSWVREAALKAVEQVTYHLCRLESARKHASESKTSEPKTQTTEPKTQPVPCWEEKICKRVVCGLLKQMVEKIARTREIAGRALERIASGDIQQVPHVPCREKILNAITAAIALQKKMESLTADLERKQHNDHDLSLPLPNPNPTPPPNPTSPPTTTPSPAPASDGTLEGTTRVDWSREKITFPVLTGLLGSEALRFSLVSGLVLSVGSKTEHLMRAASSSLARAMGDGGLALTRVIGKDFIQILTDERGKKRVTLNTMKTAAFLLANESFQELSGESDGVRFGLELHKTVAREVRNSTDVNHLLAGMRVHLGLLAFPNSVRSRAMKSCLDLLSHQYPKVRSITAEEMYSQLLTYEECVDEEVMDDVLEILSDTEWNKQLPDLYDTLDDLHGFLGHGKVARKAIEEEKDTVKKVSYLDLVKEMGY